MERSICSIFHSLVEEIDHVNVPCFCDVHLRCALGFFEDAIPRARFVVRARYDTCLNPALHENHQKVDLPPLLQHVRTIGR